jgi:protein SDA1
MCRALILMRNKNLLEPTALLPLFFRLLHCQDRRLRKYLETHIIADVKSVNAKHKNMKVNTVLQNFMYGMIKDSNVKATKMSLNIMIELYRKNIWNDTKTVNVIASACFSKVTKVMVTAIQFFLTSENHDDSDSDSDSDAPNAKDVAMANRFNKKTRKREKNLDKVKTLMKKKRNKGKAPNYNFSALHLLHDPQGFVEKLFKQLETMNERFEVKIMTLDLISRLIGTHQLILLNYYPYVKRFLQPHQRDVTKILQFAAQGIIYFYNVLFCSCFQENTMNLNK